MRMKRPQRRGVVAVESAFVLPILLTILLAIIVGAFAVFIHQQTASLAREGARYAAVHGFNHSQTTASPTTTGADVYNNAIAPRMVAMDPNNLTYSVTWDPDNRAGSFVTVTVTYTLSVPIYGNLTLSSTSTEEIHW